MLGGDALGGERAADGAERGTAAMQARRLGLGVAAIVEQAGGPQPPDQGVDDGAAFRPVGAVLARRALDPALQHAPQILGGAREALQIVERARLQPLGRRRLRPAPIMLRSNHRPTMP